MVHIGITAIALPARAGRVPGGRSMATSLVKTRPADHCSALPDNRLTPPAIPVVEVPVDMVQQKVSFRTDQAVSTLILAPCSHAPIPDHRPEQGPRHGIAVGHASLAGRTRLT